MEVRNFDIVSDNKYFWLFFLSCEFPNAVDNEKDIDLQSFIFENYPDADSEESMKWSEEFIGFPDNEDEHEERDFPPEDGNAVIEIINKGNSLKIWFTPYETIYFLNGAECGNTGGHFKLGTLSADIFREFTEGCTDPKLPLLLLPVLAGEEENIPELKEITERGLSDIKALKKEHISEIAGMIITGILPM